MMQAVFINLAEKGRMLAKSPLPAALVSASDIGVFRGGRWLIRNVDLSVSPGEIVTLIGPNGSGKSTAAKVALGILKPDAGRVARKLELRVGYVPQKLSVDWTMPLSVERLMTLTGHQSSESVKAALAEVDIPHLAKAEVQNLSGGEFQRALIARALIRRPELLVLDEPVQGVDFTGEIALYDLISRIRERTGCGILLISHDLHVVMAKTDTVICMNGHVCCHGSPQSVTSNPEYLRLFGAKAAQTIAVYAHDHDHRHLSDGTVAAGDGKLSFDHHVHGPNCNHGHEFDHGPAQVRLRYEPKTETRPDAG
jgi:zinc transport system ATP-binding protein